MSVSTRGEMSRKANTALCRKHAVDIIPATHKYDLNLNYLIGTLKRQS